MKPELEKKLKGQGLIEYVALTALVAIVCVGTVKVFGSKIRTRLNQVTKTFDSNVQSAWKDRNSKTDDNDTGLSDLF